MLLIRVITALVLLAVILPTLFFSTLTSWGALCVVFLCLAGWEWARLLAHKHAAIVGIVLGVAGLLWLIQELPIADWARYLALTLHGLSVLFWLVLAPMRLRGARVDGGGVVLVFVLLGACWLALYELRAISVAALLVAMAIVWVADIGAYFVGRGFGRTKLAPSISPGKSWEGAIGGAGLVAIIGLIAAAAPSLSDTLPALLVSQWGPVAAALVLAGLAGMSVVGDLHESLLKRRAGVKDSGKTLPGHGGVLDRIDALLPTMSMVALLHFWLA